MRIPSSVSWALVIASAIVSTVLWRELRTERQLVADMRAQLGEARADLGARPQLQPAVTATPEPSIIAPAPADSLAAPPDKAVLKTASAARLVESVKRQNALLEDSEYRKARVAQARSAQQQRFPNLARDLGLSEREADALFTMLAESELHYEAEFNSRIASGATSDDAIIIDARRLQEEQKQQQKDALVALLGPQRYTEFQEYEQTTTTRARSGDIAAGLTQAGKPLTAAQSKSLTTLMITEQRRQESESQTQPPDQSSSVERAIASDRRVLDAAAAFLDAQQTELLKTRFEQSAARKRAAIKVEQRTNELQGMQGAGGGN